MHFSQLSRLIPHLSFLRKRISTEQHVFLVGGCVRDLLLGFSAPLIDIDFTMAGTPDQLRASLDTKNLSCFMTEKFGTITLIKKSEKKSEVKYELTPLRTESGYQDFRHPGEILWSNDIVLDAQRRDFTINCMYYTTIGVPEKQLLAKKKQTICKEHLTSVFDILKKHRIAYLPEQRLLILQEAQHITQLFPQGIYAPQALAYLNNAYNLHLPETNFQVLIDPFHGLTDMHERTLCTVGDPDKRFGEDALRLIRAIRFVNVLNQKLQDQHIHAELFDFLKETWNAIKRNKDLLHHVAKERIKDELLKIFSQGNPFGAVALLDESQLLEYLFPALYATKFIHQPVRFHPFDVYTHTLLTVYELQQLSKNPLVRLGMLYHDVGKVEQFSRYKDNLSREEIREIMAGPYNHRKYGPELVKQDFAALGFSKKDIEDIAWYVANHHAPEAILDGDSPEKRTKKMRKFLSEAGFEKVNDILDITIADRRGQYNPLQNNTDLTEITELRELVNKLHKEEGQFQAKDLAINGNDLIKHFGFAPGAIIGELLHQAFDWVLGNVKKRNKKHEIFLYLGGYLKNKGLSQTDIEISDESHDHISSQDN